MLVRPSASAIPDHVANEQTAFRPKSPYGVAKSAAISLAANYRFRLLRDSVQP
jgi:GDP-D-mannose dehydratase